MNHADIIDALGGSAFVADKIGERQNVVANWKKRGIAWRYRVVIAKMARRKRIALPANFLEPSS